MRSLVLSALLVTTAAFADRPALAQMSLDRTLQLRFDADGLVTLRAHNVTVREVLAEWARQCRCFVVNAQNLAGGTMAIPVQFDRQPQERVLESLLRQAAGYVLTPRRPGAAGPSEFETIYILASSNAAPTAYSPPPMVPQVPAPTMGAPEDEIPPVIPVPGIPRPDQPQPAQEPAPAAPTGPRPPGTPGVFVPIVPIGPAQPSTTPPGTVTPAPQAPAPGTAPPPAPAPGGR